jgi:hypothetical protein
MNLEEIREYREQIINLTEQYNSTNVRVFGSVARGESTENSDIDFLIDPTPEQDLFDLIRLTRSLKELLHCDVDVIHSNALHPTIKDQITKEAIPL